MNLLCALAAAAFVAADPAVQSASRVGGFYMAAPQGRRSREVPSASGPKEHGFSATSPPARVTQ